MPAAYRVAFLFKRAGLDSHQDVMAAAPFFLPAAARWKVSTHDERRRDTRIAGGLQGSSRLTLKGLDETAAQALRYGD